MIEVSVFNVISQSREGAIFSGHTADGTYVRVLVSHDEVFPVAGETYLIDIGQMSHWIDEHSGHLVPQYKVDKIDRIKTSGALMKWWLRGLKGVGIGEKRAERLIKAYPDSSILDALQGGASCEELGRVIQPTNHKTGAEIAAQLISAFSAYSIRQESAIAEGRFFAQLETYGVTNRKDARRFWRLIGNRPDYEARILATPYMAASLMPWSSADRMGQALLRQRKDKGDLLRHHERLLGAVESSVIDILRDGHTAVFRDRLKVLVERKGVKGGDANKAITEAGRLGIIRWDGERKFYRLAGAIWQEEELAERLRSLMSQMPSPMVPSVYAELDNPVRSAEALVGVTLTEEQRGAVWTLMRLPLGVLQGGAGVGKTFVTKVLAACWESLGGNVVLCALAGKATVNLAEQASYKGRRRVAYTIARLVRMHERALMRQAAGELPDPDTPILDKRTLLVVDEGSMVDLPSFHDLVVRMLPNSAHALFVGDHGQLESVGMGQIFHDLVADGSCLVELKEVHRQAKDNPILRAASAIRAGQVPDIPPYVPSEPGCDLLPGIYLHEVPHPETAREARVVYEALRKQYRIQDLMLVAARKKTVRDTNWACTEKRPLGTPVQRLGPLATVAAGEPVVATQNRYREFLFNGMLGVVDSIDGDLVTVLWDGEDKPRSVSPQGAAELELAFAITCHKAQGSGAPIVFILLDGGKRLISRRWIYTAITRAKDTVILFGSREVLAAAVATEHKRVTGFHLSRHFPH